MSSFTDNGGPDMVEGCNPGTVRFTRTPVTNQPLVLQYYIQGTAVNGTDYTAMDEEARIALLLEELATPRPLVAPGVSYSDETRGELAIFHTAQSIHRRYGKAAIEKSISAGPSSLARTAGISRGRRVTLPEPWRLAIKPKSRSSA